MFRYKKRFFMTVIGIKIPASFMEYCSPEFLSRNTKNASNASASGRTISRTLFVVAPEVRSTAASRDAADFREVRIGEVTENYIFHYAFMTESLYRELYGEAPVYNLLRPRSDRRRPPGTGKRRKRRACCQTALQTRSPVLWNPTTRKYHTGRVPRTEYAP